MMLKNTMQILILLSICISSYSHSYTTQTFTYALGSYLPDDPDLDEECDYDWDNLDDCYDNYTVEKYAKLLIRNGNQLIKFTETPQTAQTQLLNGYKYGGGRTYITATARVSSDGIINNPVYFISGYDKNNDQGYEQYYYMGFSSLESDLLDQGYDVIFVDINQEFTSNGMFNDVSSFTAFLKAMNSYLGIKNNENTVIGFSAGGIVARVALKQMENSGMAHQTHTYISYDTPHQGANPTASAITGLLNIKDELEDLCDVTYYLSGNTCKDKEAKLNKIESAYKSRRSQELLITGAYNHDFFQSIDNIGYPEKTRNIALSNGRNGLEKGYETGALLLKKKIDFDVKSKSFDFYAENIASKYKGYFNYSDHRFDNAPGSTASVLWDIATNEGENTGITNTVHYGNYVRYDDDGDGYANLYTQVTNYQNVDDKKGTTFVPVVSAFDANTSDLYANVCAEMTPFDAIHSLEYSDKHTNLAIHSSNIVQQINKTLNPSNIINYPLRDSQCYFPVTTLPPAECHAFKSMDNDHSFGHLTSQTDTSCSYLVSGSDEDGTDGCTHNWDTTWEDWDEYYHYECEITVPR